MPITAMCARDCVLVIARILEHAADAPSAAHVHGRRDAKAARGEVYVLPPPHRRQLHARLAIEPAVVTPDVDARRLFGCRQIRSGRSRRDALSLCGGRLLCLSPLGART